MVGLLGVMYRSNDLGRMLEIVELKSSPSSAYPEAINLVRNDAELDELLPKLYPEWLDVNGRNWRLYESDAQVNVWWNALFDMPLVRGYIDPPLGTNKMGQIFLTDQAVGAAGLVNNFDYPEDVARNMALYYIDWNAMRYFEGGHVSISDNKAPSSYLKDVIEEHSLTKTVGLYRLYETKSGKPEIMDIPQYLEFYRFKDEIVSPVLSISTAPSVLFIGDWPGYESLLKVLSMNNIHSRKLITAFSEKRVDRFSEKELAKFDALILSNYSYRNRDKTFSVLSKYVSSGGALFIDTGGEVRDSESDLLPEIFPFANSQRQGLGREWELSVIEDPVFSDIDFESFSPPIFDGAEWKFSYPVSGVDSRAEVLLSQREEPLMMRWNLGEGEVIWSGMNFAYHVNVYNNFEESKFFVKILESLVPLQVHKIVDGKAIFRNSQSVEFESDISGRGVLFKEQFYPGWKIRINGRKAKVYAAGPAYPGFMYVPLENDEPIRINFSYWGRLTWHLADLMSLIVVLILIDLSLLGGRLIGKRTARVSSRLVKGVGSWWEKEEE
jgi:hypothetical protein